MLFRSYDTIPHNYDRFTTSVKLIYLFEPGGKNVRTQFFSNDIQEPLGDYCIEPFVWHLLNVDILHSVVNIEPGQVRKAIACSIFR